MERFFVLPAIRVDIGGLHGLERLFNYDPIAAATRVATTPSRFVRAADGSAAP